MPTQLGSCPTRSMQTRAANNLERTRFAANDTRKQTRTFAQTSRNERRATCATVRPMLPRFVLSTVLVATACQQAAPSKREEPAPRPSAPKPAEAVASARFDSPEAVYKRYAE